jgi:glyoxylase-like metal-dependent hydrolase (beta-lactamase superfamily II)
MLLPAPGRARSSHIMKRAIVLSLLLAAASIPLAAVYQQTPPVQPSAKALEVEKVRDNLFVLKNQDSGGNTAVFITAGGVVIVDTKNPGWGQPILERIRELTDKPVTTIVNTHTHGDHLSGNVEFQPTVDVVVHENTAKNIKQTKTQDGKPTIFEASKGRGLPKRTFTNTLTVGSGSDRIELVYFGRGHTNGDAWIVFPALRVMHAGDMFARKGVPFIDGNNGGSGVALPETLSKAADYAKNVDTIITGHSAQMTVADLREYAAFNRDFLNAVREAKKAGTSADDLAKSWKIPEKYAGYQTPDPARVKSNIDVIVAELK